MLKDFELILRELNKGFERKDLEITLLKYDVAKAKEEADEWQEKFEKAEQRIAELEAEITKLSTSMIVPKGTVLNVVDANQDGLKVEIKTNADGMIDLANVEYEMEGAE